MFKECRHILPTGYKCKSPALRGQFFCYYHTASRRYAAISRTSAEPLVLPSIEDTGGVQIAINEVLRDFGARRIDRRQAGVYFYGLQIAARLARKIDEKPSQTVRELSGASRSESAPNCETDSQTPAGGDSASTGESAPSRESIPVGELAPEKTICEPPQDCLYCHRRDFCSDWGLHRSDAKELLVRLRAEEQAREANPDLESCTPKPFDQ